MKTKMSFPPQAAGIWVWSKWKGMAADILVFLNQFMAYSLFFVVVVVEILCVRVFACTTVCALCVFKYAYSESEEGIGSLGTGVTDSCQL